jgi:ApaG protein
MAEASKYEIAVGARPQFLDEQSDVEAGRFVFAYTIAIRNTGSVGAQLISRHWVITDGDG